MNKIKLTVDSLLIATLLLVASCATNLTPPPDLESPVGNYEIHKKNDFGKVTNVYKTKRFTEVFGDPSYVSFVDASGKPQKVESYDIYKR